MRNSRLKVSSIYVSTIQLKTKYKVRFKKVQSDKNVSRPLTSQNHKWLPKNFFGFTEQVSRTIKPVKRMKILGTKMTPEILSKNQLNAENNLRLKKIQNVRKESGRIQCFTNYMQEDSQLLPNKLPSLKFYPLDFFPKNPLKADFNVRLN